ncbi:MAG TPA: hypothetical protein VFG05_09925, partial [Methylocella sp.]|nr:hypothetical protein [Methylocella sp.]
ASAKGAAKANRTRAKASRALGIRSASTSCPSLPPNPSRHHPAQTNPFPSAKPCDQKDTISSRKIAMLTSCMENLKKAKYLRWKERQLYSFWWSYALLVNK